ITELISDIFSFYGWDNDNTQAITAILSSSHRNSLMTISDLIRIIESDIATNAKHDVDGLPLSNAVIIQTVHKSKGLEYPIVILPRMDSKTFPLVVNDDSTFVFSDTMGIRCKEEVIGFGGEKSLTESWKTDAVIKSEVQDYSEERRLLFVGISRAKQYVTIIAGKTPSVFYKYYQGRYGEVEGGTEPIPVLTAAEEELIDRPAVAPIRPRRKNIPVHGLMHLDKSGYRAETESDEFNKKGMQYGTDVHKLAEMLVRGKTLEDRLFKEYPQLNMARDIITELGAKGAEMTAEKECSLPLNELNATIRGVIDMFAEFSDRIEVHDWKTDGEPVYVDEYKLQLTVYAMVLAHMKNKPVECHIDWLTQGRSEVFAPLSAEIVTARAKEFLSAAVKFQDASEEEDTL
ncbi:MAG: PD-(D/E)XK nuclease family protein, partial [Candidatus Methanomethylophilus sp.]|nr:PD-(D/E)XK nuclease family protein [Methanomethylophilus sp.]